MPDFQDSLLHAITKHQLFYNAWEREQAGESLTVFVGGLEGMPLVCVGAYTCVHVLVCWLACLPSPLVPPPFPSRPFPALPCLSPRSLSLSCFLLSLSLSLSLSLPLSLSLSHSLTLSHSLALSLT